MIVYVNGCSFGLPVGPDNNKICYGDLIAKNLNAKFITDHRPGAGNRRIIRSSLRNLINLKKQTDEPIIALIGLSFIFRTELWQPNLLAYKDDGHFYPIRTATRVKKTKEEYYTGNIQDEYENTDPAVRDWYKQWMIWQNKESLITDQLADIIMFASFCKFNNIQYLIWNNADVWPGPPEVNVNEVFLVSFVEYVKNYVNLIDPWEFAFLPWALSQGLKPIDEDIYGLYGHPGPEAHERLANFLLEKIKDLT